MQPSKPSASDSPPLRAMQALWNTQASDALPTLQGTSIAFGLVACLGGMLCGPTYASEVAFNAPGEGWVTSISNNGVAAGSSTASGEYFIWHPITGNVIIGGVSAGGGVGGQAGINAAGTVVCGSEFNSLSGKHEAARYDIATGAWTTLGGFSAGCDASISSGWGMSGNGTTVVGLGWDACSAYATYWTGTAPGVSLGTSVPGNSTRANAVSHDASVIVGWQDASVRQGAVWVNGTQELINLPGGSPAFEASAVSPSGTWVTGIGIGSIWGIGDSWRYNTVTNETLVVGNLDVGGGRYMAGTGISDDGSMIVGGTWPLGPATLGQGFVWRAGKGTQHITDYFDEVGVSYPPNFTFAFVAAMSGDGRWLAGWGNDGSPSTVSWFVELPGAPSCLADLDASGDVEVNDVLILIGAWGGSGGDVNGDGTTDTVDLLALLGAWGPCEG